MILRAEELKVGMYVKWVKYGEYGPTEALDYAVVMTWGVYALMDEDDEDYDLVGIANKSGTTWWRPVNEGELFKVVYP